MELTEEDLTVFYIDDSQQIQGPYAATTILDWCRKGFFTDKHKMKITDNGERVGNRVDISHTLGELRARFGRDKPIPTTFAEADFRGFSLNPLSNVRNMNVIKPKETMTIKKEVEDEGDSLEAVDVNNTSLPTPRRSQVAGPELPESMRKRERSRSSDHNNDSKKSKSVFDNKTGMKKSSYDDRKDTQKSSNERKNEHDYSSERKKDSSRSKKESSSSREKTSDLPFYSGDYNRDHKRLDMVVAIELALFLNSEYHRLDKSQRSELHKVYSLLGIPERCDMCRCIMKAPTNFITHVLSAPHIRKCTENKDRRFTFEWDYLSLKHDIERVKKIPPVKIGPESSNLPTPPAASRIASPKPNKRRYDDCRSS